MRLWVYLLLLATALALALWRGASDRDLLVGVASGVVAASVWAWAESLRRKRTQADRIAHLVGKYRIRMKGDTSGKDYGVVALTLDGAILSTASDGVPPAGKWEGELTMSESYPTSGTGSYRHLEKDGWGFHSVQVRGRDLLVHASWVRDRALITDAFLWTRIDD
jgi:hypothetical protein